MKSIFYFTTSLLCFSAALWTDEAKVDETAPQITLPPSVGYQPEAVTTEPRGLITPTVAPRVNKGQDILIDADFIWWKSYVSNFEYAQIDGNILTPKFQFEPGFKLGTGMDLYHDGWDIYTEYTWLRQPESMNSGTSTDVGYSSFMIAFAQGRDSGILSSIPLLDTTAWRKSEFNILDAEVGRNFFISKRLTLRPHIGLKGASLFEKTKIIYSGTGSVEVDTLILKQNLSGIGIRGGVDTVWHIIPSFGFYGDLSFTALWGSFHNTLSNRALLNGSAWKTSLYRTNQDIVPIFEAGLGLTYMTWFKDNKYQLYAKAGWEEQIWLGYNKNLVNGQISTGGSLTLQGFTAKLGLVF